MHLNYSQGFKKNFLKRVPANSSLEKRYKERLTLFIANRRNPMLRDHKLVGTLKGLRAFSVTGDVRVIYVEENDDSITLIDIGTHNQIYK